MLRVKLAKNTPNYATLTHCEVLFMASSCITTHIHSITFLSHSISLLFLAQKGSSEKQNPVRLCIL